VSGDLPPQPLTLEDAAEQLSELWTVVGQLTAYREGMCEALEFFSREASLCDAADRFAALAKPPRPNLRLVQS
jgi:hypothetical protein